MKMLLAAILLLSSGAAAAADLNLSRGPGAPGAHRENRRLSGDLQALRREYGQHRQARTQTPFRSRLHVEATETVAITVAYESSGETAKQDLRRLGARRVKQYGRLISAELPVAALAELERLESIRLARPSYRPILRQGRTTSQAVTAFRADEVRSEFAVDGTGISIGTLSDSFDCFGDAAADVASDDLPADIVVLAEPDPCDTSDEGRAMMQLIHDVAPGARQLFHSAFVSGEAEFALGIEALADAGADVIVDDVLFLGEPMFQDGVVAQAVDAVTARGVSYFSSAGNSGADSYESVFRPSGQIIGDFGEAHDFDPGDGVDIFQAVAVPPGAQLTATLQWDSPFFSVSGDPGSPNDVDILFVLDGTIVGGSATNNVAGDAVEVGSFTNSSQSFVRVDVVITLFAGPPPGLIKYVINRAGVIEEFDTNSSTIYGHANAEGASAVGAVAYFETPEFGVSPPVLEAFSSVGRTPILFDLDGEAINVSRQKPEFSCVDGTNTTFFGQDVEPDGFPNFFGTSAAAPHAAAIAALLLDLDPTLSAQDLEDAIVSTAIDMPPAGIDDQSGAGLCDALDAVRSVADAGLTLTVSPSLTAVAEPGREVTFTVRVNNTGNTPVTLVELNDSVSGSLTDRCALPQTVSGGATLTCAYAQEVFGNGGETQESTVSARGETPLGEVSAAGTATVDITDVLPALRVEKSVFPSRVPEPGWRPEYTVRVQNLTSEALELVALVDDVDGDLDGQGSCAVPASIGPQAAYECRYSVSVNGSAGDQLTSTTTATVRDDEDNTAAGSGSATVSFFELLAVTSVAADVTELDEPGATVEFSIRVDNVSGEARTLLALDSDIDGSLDGVGDCAVPQTIEAGAAYACRYEAEVLGVGGSTVGRTVTATLDADGDDGLAVGRVEIRVLDLLPTAAATLSAALTDVNEPGGDVTFSARVENTSLEPLTLIRLADSRVGDLNGRGTCQLLQSIGAGEAYTCSFTAPVEGAAGSEVSRTLTASLEDLSRNPVNVSGVATVSLVDAPPSAVLTLVPDLDRVPESGAELTFNVRVENTSFETLNVAALVDDVLGDLSGRGSCQVPETLAAGARLDCAFSVPASGEAGAIFGGTSRATVEDLQGNRAEVTATRAVPVVDSPPLFTLEASIAPARVDEPDGELTVQIDLSNAGSETFTVVALADALRGSLDGRGDCETGAVVSAGESYRCRYPELATSAGTLELALSAEVRDDEGNSVAASARPTAQVNDRLPAIVLTSTTQLLADQNSVSVELRVENIGVEAVTLESLDEAQRGVLGGLGDCSVPQALAVGAVYSCSLSVDAGSGGFEFTARAIDDEGNPATATASATVPLPEREEEEGGGCAAAPVSLGCVLLLRRRRRSSAV